MDKNLEETLARLKRMKPRHAWVVEDEHLPPLARALAEARDKQPQAVATIRKEGFVFDGSGGRWEKLAFSFYTDLCQIHQQGDQALAAFVQAVREARGG